jgi:uncharacterized membrane protein YgcG
MQVIDLLLSITGENNSHAAYFINKYGIDRAKLIEFYNENYNEKSTRKSAGKQRAQEVLEEYCDDLNEHARQGKIDPVIGREQELEEITHVLAKRNKSNILMVGDPGVGKTAIAEGLAKKIVDHFTDQFVTGVTDPMQRQVFGANLNGNKNNGQLNKFIPCNTVNRLLKYNGAQFGQLLNLLSYRLTFIANRDPEYIKRYKENLEERQHFETLRSMCRDFCDFLTKEGSSSISDQWAEIIVEARKVGKVEPAVPNPVKLTADDVEKKSFGQQKFRENQGFQKKQFRTKTSGQKQHRGPGEHPEGWNVVESHSGKERFDGPRTGGSRGGSRGGFRGRGGSRGRSGFRGGSRGRGGYSSTNSA